MPNNRTHGIIRATVDITKGPAPADVKVYYAETLDNKRIDFRLVSLDPDTKKTRPTSSCVEIHDNNAKC